MSRLVFFLSLLAAFSGTPLRQAEAADDLSRALAERHEEGNIATVDGGVGDDAGDAITANPTPATVEWDRLDVPTLSVCDPPGLRLRFDLSRLAAVHGPPVASGRRQAMLQCFRF